MIVNYGLGSTFPGREITLLLGTRRLNYTHAYSPSLHLGNWHCYLVLTLKMAQDYLQTMFWYVLLEDLQMMLECCLADLLDCSRTANKDVKMLIIVYEESANNLLKRNVTYEVLTGALRKVWAIKKLSTEIHSWQAVIFSTLHGLLSF